MTFKELIASLRENVKSTITAESTEEEIKAVNSKIADFDELESAYNKVVDENAKFKDTIVRMVTTQGDSKQPEDGSDGSKPKTIEQCIAEELEKGKGE